MVKRMNGLPTSIASRSQPEKVAEAFFLGVLFMIAFLGNGTICCAMLQPYRLKTPSNLFPFSLAVANLSLALLHTPSTMASVIMDQWPFDNAWCQTSGMLINLVSMASNFSIVTIAVYRYYLIVRPLSVTISIRRARTMVTFIWFTSFVTAVPPLFGWNSYRYIPGKAFCSVDWQDGGPGLVYSIYLVIVSLIVPFVILLYIYRAIYLKTKRQRMITDYNTLQGLGAGYFSENPRQRNSQTCYQNMYQKLATCLTRNNSQNSTSSPPTSERENVSSPATSITFSFEPPAPKNDGTQQKEEIRRRREVIKQTLTRQSSSSVYEQKTVQNAFILLLSFLVNLAPYYIVGIWSGFSQQTPSTILDFIVTWMFVCMTAVNPILYGFLNRQIRRVVFKSTLGQLLACQVCRCWNTDLDNRFSRAVSGWGRRNLGLDSDYWLIYN